MSRHGKKYFNALKKAPQKAVALEEAVKFVKANAGAKFDETVDVYFHLGSELTKGDTAVRGTVKLPNGSGKKVKVAVFAGGDAAEAARQAGADFVGMADLIEKVTKEGWCDFDVAIATVEAMKEVRKCARVLGPRGLMPNPKTGTVTDDTATAVVTSSVTVPVFGFGMRPRGPSTRAHLRTSFIASTVAIATSKSHQPSFVTFSIRSAMPTKSAPAAFAASACSPPANTATLTFLPEPFGSLQTPRTAVSPFVSSLPRWKYTSTVSSNFAPAFALTNLTASSIETAFVGAFFSALKYFLP